MTMLSKRADEVSPRDVHTAQTTGAAAAIGSTASDEQRIQGAPVRVVDLVKQFGAVRAVDGVSLDVHAGEFLALLGPSGSGKTTILMTIAGFEQPSSGQILVGGRDLTRVSPNRREIGMVFQRYALFPHMAVADNIAFPLRMRRVPKHEIAARVEAALGLVRLSGYGARLPGQLSGGQQQRVAVARAVVYRPPVLLMDEPLGALDKKLREQLQLEIKHLQKQLGATVIYVTHDQEEALTMADRIGIMNEGRLEQIGSPEELYDRPVSMFVADFIGKTNFLSGTFDACHGGICSVAIEDGPMVQAGLPDDKRDQSFPHGAPLQVAVRPERIAIHRPDDLGSAGYRGVIEETVYTGEAVVCVVRLSPGVVVAVRVPSESGPRRWHAGEIVAVMWRPEDARIYGPLP